MGYRLGMKTTTVRTVHHAAHFGFGMKGANDHIIVDSAQSVPFPVPAEAKEVGAEYHSGYRIGGQQRYVYIKVIRAPEGSACENCKEVK